MESPLVSYVVATYNRKDDLAECVRSILDQTYRPREVVVVSNSTDGTSDLFEGGPLDRDCIRYYHFDGRMGVTKARNVGYEKATGDLLLTLDDDAVLVDEAATDHVVDAFRSDDQLGALAFKSRNYYTGEIDTAEFPHRDNDQAFDEPFETTYFVGVGNALRRAALDEVGLYPDGFEYGFEELDLSFRLLDAGYRIRYDPRVTVEHKQSPAGRFPGRTVARKRLENRVRVSVRNLPWRFVVVSTLLWTAYAAYLARFDPRPILGAYRSLLGARRDLLRERDVIDEDTIRHLSAHQGRLYY